MSTTAAAGRLSSISFSGAGFLGCYHMGAAALLMKHGHLLGPGEVPKEGSRAGGPPPILTGVSAGAIVSAALSAGVDADAGMDVLLEIGRRTRELGGSLDVLRPGFSLVDQVEDLLLVGARRALGGTGDAAEDYDRDLFARRIGGGRRLLIGLTDKRGVGPGGLVKDVPRAYRYVDRYRDVEDAVAASILSSYIPGVTGTLKGANCPFNGAVRRSWERVFELDRLGYVKTKKAATSSERTPLEEGKGADLPELFYWDGGIADMFPTVDDQTVVVSPVNGIYDNPSISPSLPGEPNAQIETNEDRDAGKLPPKEDGWLPFRFPSSIMPPTIQAHALAQLGLNRENAESAFRMLHSSDDDLLQARFRNGYDDAKKFLDERSMLRSFSA